MAKVERSQNYKVPADRCFEVLRALLIDRGVIVGSIDERSRTITGTFKATTSTTDKTERGLPIKCVCFAAGEHSTDVRLIYHNAGQLTKFVSPDVPTKMDNIFTSLDLTLGGVPTSDSDESSQAKAREQDASDSGTIQSMSDYGAELYKSGLSHPQIESRLIQKGLHSQSVGEIMKDLSAVRAGETRDAGRKNMLWGSLVCVAGIIATAVTYATASGGGTYVVAWGAIIFGVGQFVRGLQQLHGKVGN
jgi:hypothetical protein